MSDSTPTLERDHHMGILRQWGTATPMWAVEYIEQLEAALDASGNDELVEALKDAERALVGYHRAHGSDDIQDAILANVRAAIARAQEQIAENANCSGGHRHD